MSVANHIDQLRHKHQHLEALLQDEMKRPLPDQQHIHTIKQQKLRIRDEIEKLGSQN